jgi:WD40 repeat protein
MRKTITLISYIIWIFAPLPPVAAQTALEILVSNRGNNAISRYDEAGTYLGDFISSGSGGLSEPEDILFHADGTVLVTGFNNTSIKRYNGLTGAYMGEFSSGYTLDGPSKMSIGPDSLIYVTQWGAVQNKVVRFDLLGNFVDEFTSIGAPKGLGHTWDANKNFYISLFGATGGAGTVHKFDSSGNDSGIFINSVVLDGPTNIWFGANGDMLVEDWNAGKILRFDSTGQYVNVFVSGLTNPEGIAFLPNGNMLVCDWGVDAVHLIDSNGNLLGYFCSGSLIDPNCVKVRPSATTAVNEVKKIATFTSPTMGKEFTIFLPTDIGTNASIKIINLNGKLIERIQPAQRTKWNAGHLPPGMYIVNITSNGHDFFEKIIVN